MTRYDAMLRQEDIVTTPPAADADVHIAVVLQFTMPDQSKFVFELNRDLTRGAIEALHSVGATVSVHDVAAETPPDFGAIAAADGILVLGGGDVDSTLYGHTETVPNESGKDRRADEREIEIIRRAIDEDAIMLTVCRGSQVLNVACGGSLVPDLYPHRPHRGGPGEPLFVDEEINLVPGTRVGDLYGADSLTVRSGHHQAVDRVGEGLRVTARAQDGTVEGTERIENTWILGLQWHPEEALGSTVDRTLIFQEFVAQARQRKHVDAASSVR